MKTKRMRLKSKTVCKLHRLARELEALNGVQVDYGSYIAEGRRCFYFTIRALNPKDSYLLINCGHAFSVHEALAHFYCDMSELLWCRQQAQKNPRLRKYLVDVAPARFTTKALRDWGAGGIHGKQVVLSA